jgi:hypothetical protein
MQRPTSRQLYAYWDRVRNGRVAPRRFEIEPAKIAALLPEPLLRQEIIELKLHWPDGAPAFMRQDPKVVALPCRGLRVFVGGLAKSE